MLILYFVSFFFQKITAAASEPMNMNIYPLTSFLSEVFGTDIALLVADIELLISFLSSFLSGCGFLSEIFGSSTTISGFCIASLEFVSVTVTVLVGLTSELPPEEPPPLVFDPVAIEGVAIGLLGLLTGS